MVRFMSGCAIICLLSFPGLCRADSGPQGPDSATVVQITTQTEAFFNQEIDLATRQSREIGRGTFWTTLLLKTLQYGGGGGALIFGLNDKGRNAGYSGAVAAAATAVEQAAGLDDRKARRQACQTIEELRVPIKQATLGWLARAGDPEFRKTFPKTLDDFTASMGKAFGQCHQDEAGKWSAFQTQLFAQYLK